MESDSADDDADDGGDCVAALFWLCAIRLSSLGARLSSSLWLKGGNMLEWQFSAR